MVVASCAGSIYCLNKNDGELLWVYDFGEPMGFHGRMAVMGFSEGATSMTSARWSAVFVGVDNGSETPGRILALNLETGETLWDYRAGLGVPTDLTFAGPSGQVLSQVLGATPNQELLCLDVTTGDHAWTFGSGEDTGDAFGLKAIAPVHASGAVYWATLDGTAYRLDAETGAVVWERPLGARAATNPLLHHGALYIGTEDYLLLQLDRETGEVLASQELPGIPWGPIGFTNDKLLLFTNWMQDESNVVCVNTGLTGIEWLSPAPDSSRWTSVSLAVRDGRTLVGTDDGRAFACSMIDGELTPIVTLPSMVRVLQAAEGVLRVGCFDGLIATYDWE